jgi:hypothetical protein
MEREEAKNCCRVFPRQFAEGELADEGQDIFNNSSFEKSQRLKMLKGERPADCQSCWNLEDHGFRSPRAPLDSLSRYWQSCESTKKEIQPYLDANKRIDWQRLSKNIDANSPLLTAKAPRMLEISLGNLCDMKCIYCNEHYSSTWAAEKIKFGEITLDEYNQSKKKSHEKFEALFWEWFADEVRHEPVYINFLGGEPLINPKFYRFTEKMIGLLKEVKNTTSCFSLVTNLNMRRDHLDQFTGMLPRLCGVFRKVDINVSMESVSEKAEYIRYGVKWPRWKDNFESLAKIKNPKLEISLQMAMNALNVTSIESYLRYAKSIYDQVRIPFHARQNIVSLPEILAPTILPASFSRSVYDAARYVRSIEKEMGEVCQFDWGRWDFYGNFLQRLAESIEKNTDRNPQQMADFYDYFTKLDQRRGTSFARTFPEYRSFWSDCENESRARQGRWPNRWPRRVFASWQKLLGQN